MPTVDERARHDLFEAVHTTLGARHADTLMSLLPPVGWAEVATKDDIRLVKDDIHGLKDDIHDLEARLDVKLERLEYKVLAAMHQSHKELVRSLMFGLVGAIAAMSAVLVAALAAAT